MFTPADRDRMRELLVARAAADPEVVGAALTGSLTDRFSDTDLVLGVRGELGPVLTRSPLFGEPGELDPFPPPDPGTLCGLVWHHAWHAWICLRRDRLWQAEHWIGALRAHLITLACVRLGLPAAHGKGAHLLPDEITGPLEATLVRSMSETEMARALTAAIGPAISEMRHVDPGLAARLEPMLAELT